MCVYYEVIVFNQQNKENSNDQVPSVCSPLSRYRVCGVRLVFSVTAKQGEQEWQSAT